MIQESIKLVTPSTIAWDNLEDFIRPHVQQFIQNLLEEEVTELLGRKKHERKPTVDPEAGYRNGHGKPRELTTGLGTIELERPRVRGLEDRFKSRVLPMFKSHTKRVENLIPELYLHGLSLGDFDLALRGLLGDEAPLSPSSVARLKEKWLEEKRFWDTRSLDELEVVYLWVDGVYVKAGLEKEKACLLVATAGLSDGKKIIVGLKPGYRESNESWGDFLRDLHKRGMNCPRLIIGDGNLGIWDSVKNVYPLSQEQRCWNHKIVNVIDKLPKKKQASASELLKKIPYAETKADADGLKSEFQNWCRNQNFHDAAKNIEHDWERMVSFYSFPKDHWRHLRTTNIIESPFAYLRLRTNAAKRFKKVENATAVIWKMLLVSESRFHRLNAPELTAEVFGGGKYKDGILVALPKEKVAVG